MKFLCTVCGKQHDDLPHIGSDRPTYYWDVAPEERDKRIKLTSDTCEIDGEHFFVRGVIEIPVHDYPPGFGFGVWVSHKRENYQTYLDNFNSVAIGPFFGWLCTLISFYPQDTVGLKTTARYRGTSLRPSIALHRCDHPLFVDQHNGISLERASQIVHFYMQQNQ